MGGTHSHDTVAMIDGMASNTNPVTTMNGVPIKCQCPCSTAGKFFELCTPRSPKLEYYTSSEEARMKGKLYAERDFPAALHAYMSALWLLPTACHLKFSTESIADFTTVRCQQINKMKSGTPSSFFQRKVLQWNSPDGKQQLEITPMTILPCLPSSENRIPLLANDNFTTFQSPLFQDDSRCYPDQSITGSTVDSSDTSRLHSDQSSELKEICASTKEQGYTDNPLPANINTFPATHDAEISSLCQEIASLHFIHKKIPEAIGWYNEAIRSAPSNASYVYQKGVVYQSQNNFTAALDCFQTALNIDPVCIGALFNMGVLLYDTQPERALKYFLKILTLDSDNSEVMTMIAECYERMEKHDNAIRYLKMASALNPKNFRTLKKLMQCEETILKVGKGISTS
ncbi:tetratricopeptide repeat-containing protein [Cardiosporidium cionae]|uniref:Tetratricopeptide repeat-containing protein n=1 Tax=Cardiosporidium cionae TaxID=476202 RepID=A0ABQ7JAE6_9APIC|nr:tetratricopeptide repeat-containing protein [Cardiosporidium cionae]|eukprot:KAF8820939.1 tetratricopeptide repeat-containing protein [Cardiosporidium cionae]